MISFYHIFRESRDLCLTQGRRPVVCLLGPDMIAAYWEYRDGMLPHMKKLASDSPWKGLVNHGDIDNLCGIRLRKMNASGLAFLTVAQPESGFDLP